MFSILFQKIFIFFIQKKTNQESSTPQKLTFFGGTTETVSLFNPHYFLPVTKIIACQDIFFE